MILGSVYCWKNISTTTLCSLLFALAFIRDCRASHMMQMQRRSISGIIESIGWHRTAPGHCWAISSHMVACTVPKSSANVIFLTTPPFDGLLVTSWGRLISKGICSSSLSVGICLVYRMRPATVANRSDGRWYSALWRVFGLTDNANSLERLLPEIASVVVDDLPPQTTHVAKWRHYILACFLITVDDLILNDAFVAPCVMFFCNWIGESRSQNWNQVIAWWKGMIMLNKSA